MEHIDKDKEDYVELTVNYNPDLKKPRQEQEYVKATYECIANISNLMKKMHSSNKQI